MQDANLKRTHNLFAEVGQESYPAEDLSAEDWLHSKGANNQMLAIADACYANDFGCSIQQLGLREMITENRKWDSGSHCLMGMPAARGSCVIVVVRAFCSIYDLYIAIAGH